MESDFEANEIGLDSLTLEEKKIEKQQEEEKNRLQSIQNDESTESIDNSKEAKTINNSPSDVKLLQSNKQCKFKKILFFQYFNFICCYIFYFN